MVLRGLLAPGQVVKLADQTGRILLWGLIRSLRAFGAV